MSIDIKKITEQAEKEYKEYTKDKMIEAFVLANTAYDEMKSVQIDYGSREQAIIMMAKEFFRAMTTPAFYWISRRKAELLKEMEEKEEVMRNERKKGNSV